MKKIITAVVVLLALGILWYFLFPAFVTKEVQEAPPETTEILENGFKRESLGVISSAEMLPDAHEVAGTASLIEGIDGKVYLRFENFEIINGPDVRIYLSKDLEKTDAVELGPLKATHGNFNYEVPEDVHLGEYSKLLVWCDDFSVLFAHADFAK